MKRASLICEDDGEELSVEDGDLEMLLGDMTRFPLRQYRFGRTAGSGAGTGTFKSAGELCG